MFSDLERHLTTLRGAKFVFVPNPGNAGDAMIAQATYQLFERLGLDYEVGEELGKYPGRVVVYGGGGNFVPLYLNLRNFLLANHGLADRLIVLPHTIRGYENIIALLGSNCEIFCRDETSFDWVRQHAKGCAVFLSHDLAFATDVKKLVRDAKNFPIPFLSNRKLARRNVKRRLGTIRYKLKSPRVLNCFRSDAEKTGQTIPPANIDVSRVYSTALMVRADSLDSTYRLMQFVDGFAEVNTNRLHIGILGMLLGKRVNLYDNSYGKNRAVFEHSLIGFGNVTWCG